MYDIACRDFEEIRNTSECRHGARNNVCGKLACLKGAGEVCGDGLSSVFNGVCADKLMCCGICVGCYKGICSQSLCPQKRFTKSRRNHSGKSVTIIIED